VAHWTKNTINLLCQLPRPTGHSFEQIRFGRKHYMGSLIKNYKGRTSILLDIATKLDNFALAKKAFFGKDNILETIAI